MQRNSAAESCALYLDLIRQLKWLCDASSLERAFAIAYILISYRVALTSFSASTKQSYSYTVAFGMVIVVALTIGLPSLMLSTGRQRSRETVYVTIGTCGLLDSKGGVF